MRRSVLRREYAYSLGGADLRTDLLAYLQTGTLQESLAALADMVESHLTRLLGTL